MAVFFDGPPTGQLTTQTQQQKNSALSKFYYFCHVNTKIERLQAKLAEAKLGGGQARLDAQHTSILCHRYCYFSAIFLTG
jgi:hypothetical protein